MNLEKIDWDLEIVEEWLQIAAKVERALPPVRAQGYKTFYPDIVYTELELLQMAKYNKAKFNPTPFQRSIYDEVALNWYKFIDSDLDKDIVRLRSNDMGATRIGKMFGLSRQTVTNRYKKSLEEILSVLKRKYFY